MPLQPRGLAGGQPVGVCDTKSLPCQDGTCADSPVIARWGNPARRCPVRGGPPRPSPHSITTLSDLRRHRTYAAGVRQSGLPIGKARQQPEKVRQVLDKVLTTGLFATLDAVFDKLDEPVPLGYCNVGVVLEVGENVTGFQPATACCPTDRTRKWCVFRKTCVAIPESVSDDEAVFGVLDEIALQGIRLASPTLGEAFLVSGLGLIGLLAVQLLKGTRNARDWGRFPSRPAWPWRSNSEPKPFISAKRTSKHAVPSSHACGRGMDGVLITAATKSDEPVHQAAVVCRKRGRIVLTGVAGLQLSRDDFYKKELSFQVSCSLYGPGRTMHSMKSRDTTTPRVTSAGPSRATSKQCSICWPRGRLMLCR